MRVAISNTKRGVGKTTIAIGLATCAARLGNKASVVDADPIASASEWAALADKNGDALPFRVVSGSDGVLRSLKAGKDEWCFIDAPLFSPFGSEAIEASDFVVIPTQPSPMDVQQTLSAIEMIAQLRKPYSIVFNEAKTNEIGYKEAVFLFRQYNQPLFNAVIPERASLKRVCGRSMDVELFSFCEMLLELRSLMGDSLLKRSRAFALYHGGQKGRCRRLASYAATAELDNELILKDLKRADREASKREVGSRSISATVSRELYGQVAACAKVKDRSMSWVVREALKAHLG